MMKLARHITRFIDFFYIAPLRHVLPLQTFRYGVCGGGNMFFDLLLYFVLYNFVLAKQIVYVGTWIAISPHIAAWMIVFPITFFTGFWLNRHIAFHGSPLRGRVQLFRYLVSVAGSIVLNYLCMKLFVEVAHIYPTPSKALTTAVTILYSYGVQKYYTFRGCVDSQAQ